MHLKLNPKQRNKRPVFIEGWLSIIANSLLFGLKLWAGIISNSVALIADAWHTLSDSVSSIVVLVGAKVSQKPADEKHPYGHGRAELIASLVIGVLLVIVAFRFFTDSIDNIINKNQANFGTVAIVVTIISIIIKEALAQYALKSAKKINSSVLKADGWHHRSDAISSLIILIGIFLQPFIWWVDGALGILVSLFIGYVAFGLMKENVNSLLGEKTPDDVIEKVRSIAEEVSPYNLKLHHFHSHIYGDHIEISFHIVLPGTLLMDEAHNISVILKKRIYDELGISSTIQKEIDKSNQD